jgi:hypothetical protein
MQPSGSGRLKEICNPRKGVQWLKKALNEGPPPGGHFVRTAPFNVHDVEQVTIFPFSHLMQTSVHCSNDFGL